MKPMVSPTPPPMRAPILAKKKFHTNEYHITRAGGETIDIKHTSLVREHVVRDQFEFGKVAGSDCIALTFLPDRWLTTMFHGRGHSVLFDPSRVTRNVGLLV